MVSKAVQNILLKISGEFLAPPGKGEFDPDSLIPFLEEIKEIGSRGGRVAIVIGGGNFWRGDRGVGKRIDRVVSDQIGMLATVMNGMALKSLFATLGVNAHLESAMPIGNWYPW